ncbi:MULTISPECIES: HesA/MoeB/ThiF family protein [unclassified Pedobacter]|uniref:HesA/MoeB/ThiF family protein n=1 Tax=unclassified Pedobacter TaxID=2628915 RepID=UPI00141E789C|nr:MULTISPECIES: HesA/MoeB/ThiF family protein [unclassified Pedobacter]NII84233.1 adenylyltransferase/sulfurtransferase [Pedobacter sp. SG908]NMN38852.1 adenylyltransferase/sulfurtransferase [Pedobacter sp. SG918]
MLVKEELNRYNRQMILPELGLEGQKKLKAASVLVIGAGGLGCPILQYLAAAGVGTIGIVDDDVVELSNLHRQILYNHTDIGQAKAKIAAAKLQLLNPHVGFTAYQERFRADNAVNICQDYDLVIDCSDNFTTRYLVNDTCVALGKTLIFGSILQFEGQVAVFNHQGSANYRDLYPAPPTENINCVEGGVIGILPGLIGLYMANEALKLICGIGETLAGKLMSINALNNAVLVFKIAAKKSADTAKPAPAKTGKAIAEIDKATLDRWLETYADKVFLIDVREDYEHEDNNIGGINLPLYELTALLTAIPKNKKVVCYCQTGQRSKMAVQLLDGVYEGEVYSLISSLG